MALKLNSSSGGSVTLQEPTTASNYTLTVPAQTGTIATTVDTGNYYAFKNRIINGNMAIDQRNAGASVTPTNGQYTLDRWGAYAFGSATSKFTVQQSSTAPTGFKNSLQVTSTSSYSVASGDITAVYQIIEGYNAADLGFGAAGAATITISFWVRSSLTGTFGGAIKNGGSNRAYPFSYTISSANTWEQKSVTIAGDTTGTWLTTNGQGLFVIFGLGVGSTYSGTAGAWASSDLYSATGATSVVGTSGATFYITGVQLEKGTVATSFDYRPYGTELALCQRYFELVNATFSGYTGGGNNAANTALFTVTKRAVPTMTWLGGVAQINFSQASAPGIYQTATVRNFYPFRTATGTGQDSRWEDAYSASAEL